MSEPAQCRDIRRLKPLLAKHVLDILWVLRADGYHPFVLETYRSAERQAWLRKKGTTWVKRSKHQDGEACDIGFKTKDGKVIWTGSYPGWKRLAELAKRFGLVAGHNWRKVDSPHIEMK